MNCSISSRLDKLFNAMCSCAVLPTPVVLAGSVSKKVIAKTLLSSRKSFGICCSAVSISRSSSAISDR